MQNATIAMDHASTPSPAPTSYRTTNRPLEPLRPALLARYDNLDRLRYEYPLVLIEGDEETPLIRPLSRIIDEILRATAPKGSDGEALRQQVLKLETAIRQRVASGREGLLSEIWNECVAELLKESGQTPFGELDQKFDLVRQKIKINGQIIGCHRATPAKVFSHVWKIIHKARSRRFRNKVDGLVLKLTDILKSDHMKSDEAHGAPALSSAMGKDGDNSIDFGSLSQVLHRARPEDRLPPARVGRIQHSLNVLQSQAFFGPARTTFNEPEKAVCYRYVFRSCSEALDAYRERLPDVVEFTKALTIAELEVDNKYRPDLHDKIFERFDESDLTPEQMELLPPALILLHDGVTDSAEISRAFEALACGLPIKVVVQVDDILGSTSPEPALNSFGAGTTRLGAMAMGLNNAFVLQSTSAHLYRMRGGILRGMQYAGPTMFSIYSGATDTAQGIDPYILAAAATESRAYPNFTYDPSAGKDWAQRFDLSANPQVDKDWPKHELVYEDKVGQKQNETVAFTMGHFALCDERYRRFCRKNHQEDWDGEMIPFSEWLKISAESREIRHPYLLGVDAENKLHRVVVEDKIVAASRRCNDAWRRLQELAGINNSHALALLAEEKRKREALAREQSQSDAQSASISDSATQGEPAAKAPDPAPVVEELDDDAPWIETARCTTCNECKQINDKLFAYDENMQAYIADPDAGTYRQLVEAAESCQVSVIHPGKPRDPNEANLEELMERAEPFN